MEFKDMRKKIISGKFPDFGAIFMSNGSTMEECLEKKLFGLPNCHSDFVRRVKSGMLLFLFEYEKRKLYGVFEATSDGETNIVPHAYSSSGRHFPAQVRITTIWQCHPISEHEFRDVIEGNYFSTNKFNFGLSKDQVRKLLSLFNSRRVTVPKSQRFTKMEVRKQYQKSSNESKKEKERSNQHENTLHDCSYCPKANCFQSSSAFGTCSSTFGRELGTHSSHATQNQPVKCREETDLGDFIPLPPLDDSEFAGDLIESSLESLSEPYLPPMPNLFGGSFRQDYPIAASNSCDINVESSSAAFPLSNTGECLLNVGAYRLKSQVVDCQEHSDLGISNDGPCIKGLYSDTPTKNSNVICRLNFSSKSTSQEKVDYARENSSLHAINSQKENRKKVGKSVCKMSLQREYHTRVDKSVQEIMEDLQQRHDKWWKTVRRTKSLEQEDEDYTEKRRTSVFMRLSRASEAGVQENGIALRLQQGNGKQKKMMKKDKSSVLREDNSRVNKSVGNSKRLHQNVRHWKKMVRKSEISFTHRDYEENLNRSTQVKIVNYTSRGNEGDMDYIWSSSGMAEDTSCLDFNCRGEMLRTKSETERSSCIIGVESNCSLENQRKRKLVESLLSDVKIAIHDRCPNLQTPSQESSAAKECTGSCDAAVKSERNDDDVELCRRDQVPPVILPMHFEVEDGEIVEGLELDGVRVCCVSGIVTKPLKTYKRRRFASRSSENTDNMVTAGEGKAESSGASIGCLGLTEVQSVEICCL